MTNAATTTDPRREQILAAFRTGDAYGLLGGAEGYLRAVPADDEVRAVAVRAYAGLGLAGAAWRLLDHPALDGELRTRLAGQIPRCERRSAWCKLAARFSANLAVFNERTGLGNAVQAVWRAARSRLQLLHSSDGNYQVFSAWAEAPGWLPGLFPHDQFNRADEFRQQWQGRVVSALVVNGLGLGHLPLAIVAATRETFLDFSARIVLLEPSLLAWAVNLHLHDWRAVLGESRVTICAGPDAWQRLEQHLADVERITLKVLDSGPAWPGSFATEQVAARIDEANVARRTLQRELYQQVCQTLAERDAEWWARRLTEAGRGGAPLTVVGVTSRFTTVLKYAMRDLLAAFAHIGHRTHMFMEVDNSAHFAPIRLLRDMQRLQPDVIIIVDHLRHEYPALFPDNIPGICWIQDRLPHLFTKDAGRAVRPFEFVIGHGFPECLVDFDYPVDRFYPCVIPTNPDQMCDPQERAADLEPYRCDVMFATNASSTTAELHQRYREKYDDAGRGFVDAAYETLMSIVRQPEFCGDYDYEGLVALVEKEHGLAITDGGVRGDIVGALRGMADQHLREQTIAAAARWADGTGGRFNLYGRGWEQREEYARFARGVVEHGRPLGRAFRAARISLHAGCNPALHQRVLDGLCAGGFFLIAEKPSDMAHALNQAIYTHCREKELRPPFRLAPDDLPQPQADEFARFLRVRGGHPEEGIVITQDMVLNLQAECDWKCRQRPSGVWPRYHEVVYRGADELTARVEHFLEHEDERRELAAEMRAAVLENFTYDALVRAVLAFMRDVLAGHGRSLLET